MKKQALLLLLWLPVYLVAGEITCPISRSIQSLRIQYLQDALSDSRRDPVRPYLTMPVEGVIDGSDPANTLLVSFDEMSHIEHQYAYSVQHLNADYTIDDLSSFDYVRGFTRMDITDYVTSLNTTRDYTHYSFAFPNEDMQLLISGNYLITIYDPAQGEEAPIAKVVFNVVEPHVGIYATVTPNTTEEIAGRYQQLNIDVDARDIRWFNPNEITLVVRQNDRIDNCVYAPYPSFVEANRLRWTNHKALIFEGGNEYRHFDTYSTYYGGYHVDRIRYDHQDYHAFLDIDPVLGTLNSSSSRCGMAYTQENDHNGMCVVNAERCSDIATEAEYMYVHWVLPVEEPIFDGSIYIGGDIFYNQLNAGLNRMLYDNEHRCYYFNGLVKQGGYDYQYWLKKKGEPSATLLLTEGSHWETENVYTVYVYFRSVNDRYDRLVGVAQVNSTAR